MSDQVIDPAIAVADPTGGSATLALKVGLKVFQRVAPGGIEKVVNWIRGSEILIVGQARAGKTSFIDYFQYGILDFEDETEKTYQTETTSTFKIKMGRDTSLELIVRKGVDVPGQVGAIEHANIAYSRNPQAVVIILDITTPLTGESDRASYSWLKEFCLHYEKLWITKGKKRKNKLKSMVVVINKIDKDVGEKWKKYKKSYRSALKKLRFSRSENLKQIRVMPSILIRDHTDGNEADQIISIIAKNQDSLYTGI